MHIQEDLKVRMVVDNNIEKQFEGIAFLFFKFIV